MTTFPITYICIVVYLILISYQDDYYWTRFTAKLLGSIFGIWLSINTFNGEQWLFVSPSGTYALTQVKDGFQLPISLIILGFTFVIWFTLAMSVIGEDYNKSSPSGNEPQ